MNMSLFSQIDNRFTIEMSINLNYNMATDYRWWIDRVDWSNSRSLTEPNKELYR